MVYGKLGSLHAPSTSKTDNSHNQVEYTSLNSSFYAISGTLNRASTVRALRDHRTELGYRVMEKMVVFAKKDLTMNMPETQSVGILLSERRSPPSRIPIPIRKTICLRTDGYGCGCQSWREAAQFTCIKARANKFQRATIPRQRKLQITGYFATQSTPQLPLETKVLKTTS